MSRSASGTYTLPSTVNPVVTRTVISTNWANTTLADIATELTDSLSRSGKGAMTQPLQLSDGTAAAPSLTFSADTNTGLYRIGADSMGLTLGGTLRVTYATTGVTMTGSLTIGSTLAGTIAQMGNGAVGAPTYSFQSDTDTGIYRGGANDLRISAGGADVATFSTKLSVSAATAATGGTRQDALSLTNGDLDLSAVTVPTSTTAISNRLTAANLVKAWASFTATGATWAASVDAGFNVTSVTRVAASILRVTFASAFSSANYVPMCFWGSAAGGTGVAFSVASGGRTTTTCDFQCFTTSTGAAASLDGSTTAIAVAFIGLQ